MEWAIIGCVFGMVAAAIGYLLCRATGIINRLEERDEYYKKENHDIM